MRTVHVKLVLSRVRADMEAMCALSGPRAKGAQVVQVPGGDGALAVVIMPRYLLFNGLDLRLQYRQQGIAQVHCPDHWPAA